MDSRERRLHRKRLHNARYWIEHKAERQEYFRQYHKKNRAARNAASRMRYYLRTGGQVRPKKSLREDLWVRKVAISKAEARRACV